MMRSRFACLLLVFAISGGLLRATELFAPAPIDEVSVRTLPEFTVMETETTGSLESAWERGFLFGARYAALAHSGLNTPTIMTFPDWDKSPQVEGANLHVLVQCLLDPLPDFPKVRDPGAVVQQMRSMTVACYAQRGYSSAESFRFALQKIQAEMKARGIPLVGPPRYLYYSTTSWMPSWWRINEVEVPVAVGAGG